MTLAIRALSRPDFAILKEIKKLGYYCFHMLSIQIKKIKKKYGELVEFELTTLSCSSLQALEKVHFTPELSGPINVMD